MKTIVGCSHIHFLKEGKFPTWENSQFFDYNSIAGYTAMPIYHETFVKDVVARSKTHDLVYIFPFRSVAFNVLWGWMEASLRAGELFQMDESIMLQSAKKAPGWHIDMSLLKNEKVIDVQNNFYLKWLDWYAENIPNIRFVFWCHGAIQHERGKFPPHLCYDDLVRRYPTKTVFLDTFFAAYTEKPLFKDIHFHPTEYGFECLHKYLSKEDLV